MNVIDDKPGIAIAGPQEVVNSEIRARDELEAMVQEIDGERLNSSLAGHISRVFQDNKDDRIDSGIEEKLLQSLRAYNGHYDPEDLRRIEQTGGSKIYMNLTPTKCRAAMSWIRDIMMPAKETAWSFEPTVVPDVPQEMRELIESKVQEFQTKLQESEQQEAQGGPPQPGAPPAPQQAGPAGAAVKMKDLNKLKIDLEEAYMDEVYSLAKKELKKFEDIVEDQLQEGGWESALSEFIEDFCVFQVAVMKGPIPVKETKISWENGEAVEVKKTVFLNKRVSPLDIYPSASSKGIQYGNLCEHLRLHRKELYDLIGNRHYKDEAIREILRDNRQGLTTQLVHSYHEHEKAVEEYRGDAESASKDLFHGIHYFGTASYEMLVEWGFDEEDLGDDDLKEFEIEAIMVDNKVIKCKINSDPLLRRPYYKASFQSIPGSWWGRSLPELMRDNQRMCNATARALANNMGIASGPQVEVYIDRLAADEEIEEIYPFKQWQVTSDPTGAGGRAVNFWQPSSNAQELLAVYKEYEVRADDATGIPRYAYGNERTGGAAQTASGLSMLLESASKGIKDAIRHIDDGLIKPRVEYQFYWNMLKMREDEEITFSGDVNVVPRGSQTLTMKGAQEMRRNEFLQILANPSYLNIVGIEGVAEILREMAKSLGLGENIVPSRIELKLKQKELEAQQAQQQQQQMQIEQQKSQQPLQAVQMQTQQADVASQRKDQIKIAEIQTKAELEMQQLALKAQELEQRERESVNKNTAALTKQQMADAQKDRTTNKNIALSIQSGYQDKNNQR